MGNFFSCPFSTYSDTENGLESIIVKSINFGNDEVKTPVRSVSFNDRDPEPTIMKSVGSGKMKIEASVSFKGKDIEELIFIRSPSSDKENNMLNPTFSQKGTETENSSPRSDFEANKIQSLPILDPYNPKHMAAVKLQKVYKSFRTRRKLADCAILVEQSWWKLLDFAELKHSSISFFDIEKHETAISRWSRARTRAAKVGKGLSKSDKAQKLALQHWLEAIDPRHRYGHNLHLYYVKWLQCQSREPFFYWLDIGEGREVNLIEKCPRSKLQQQCIKYLGPMERLAYEVVVKEGKFFYKQSDELLSTADECDDAKWIFVLSTSKTMYVGKKKKGTFQHSSFLAGGATSAAGRLVVENGILKAVWPHSGHYRPTEENFKEFIAFLTENNVDLSEVKMSPVDEADGFLDTQSGSHHFRNNSSEEELVIGGLEAEVTNVKDLMEEKAELLEQESVDSLEVPEARRLQSFRIELATPEMDKWGETDVRLSDEIEVVQENSYSFPIEGHEIPKAFMNGEEYMVQKQSLFGKEQNENEAEMISEESILKRIHSHKETKSFQLGKHLSRKWTTGAGPRISCVRDYPSELQFRALEQVNLSPRRGSSSKTCFSRTPAGLGPKVSTPRSDGGETAATFSSTPPEIGYLFQKDKILSFV